MKIIGQVAVYPAPGARIARLSDLAYNLWWSWNPAAQDLFKRVDPELWAETNHNPVKFLRGSVSASSMRRRRTPPTWRATRR